MKLASISGCVRVKKLIDPIILVGLNTSLFIRSGLFTRLHLSKLDEQTESPHLLLINYFWVVS